MWSFSIKMFWKQWKFNITYCAVCNKEEKGRGEVQLYLKKGFQARLHNAKKTANMPKCLRCVFMQFKVQEYPICVLSSKLWMLTVKSFVLVLPWSILHLKAFLCSCDLKRLNKNPRSSSLLRRFNQLCLIFFLYHGHVLWNIVSFDLFVGPRPDLWACHAVFGEELLRDERA